ncbi:MAG: membrane protein insertase YidC, partial [Bacteroidia bacterium]
MDRKSLIAIVLMAVIFFIWSSYLNSSKEKEAALQKKYDDSLALVEKKRKRGNDSIAKLKTDSIQKTLVLDSAGKVKLDSMNLAKEKDRYGFFSEASKGDNTPLVIENEKLKISIFPRGGRIGQVELKGVKTYSGKPLILFTPDSTHFGLQFFDAKRRLMNTDSLYFKADGKAFAVTGNDSNAIRMRLYADGTTNKYIEYVYALRGGSYMPSCSINFVGLDGVVDRDLHSFDLQWSMNTPVQEKSLKNERMVATVHYRFDDETVESLSKTETENKQLTGSVKWVGFAQQYFTSTLIPKTSFTNGSIVDVRTPSDPFAVKHFGALLPVPYTHGASESFATKFYFGPSDYHQLKSYNLDLEKQLDLGWGPFAWINKYAIFPIFDFLSSFIGNYGIVILLITIIVKIVLFPIAYKSFLSSAKMRVLKPEIDEINEKYKDGDPLEKNKATMGLYRKAGVNPMAGCIPLLLQIPILFALIRFFPSAYDLRQASFLWAEDLSTYDSIWTFGHVPVIDT